MALTQISTGGVKNDAVTAGKIPADAVGQSEIADEAVDEARLQISNAGSNGQFLSKQSGNTGGLTWADANSYTHPNHSGEVTSTADGAQVIASNVVDEDNLKISNSGTNGQFLSKQSGDTGGLTWATVQSAPTITGTMTGSVAQDKPVQVKSDGTLEAVSQINAGPGTAQDIATGGGSDNDSWDETCRTAPLGGGKFATIYINSSHNPECCITEVDPDTNAVSKGSTTVLTTGGGNTSNFPSVAYDHTNSRIVYSYVYAGDLYARVATVSGTTQTFGTEVNVVGGGQYADSCFVQGADAIFWCWEDGGNIKSKSGLTTSSRGLTLSSTVYNFNGDSNVSGGQQPTCVPIHLPGTEWRVGVAFRYQSDIWYKPVLINNNVVSSQGNNAAEILTALGDTDVGLGFAKANWLAKPGSQTGNIGIITVISDAGIVSARIFTMTSNGAADSMFSTAATLSTGGVTQTHGPKHLPFDQNLGEWIYTSEYSPASGSDYFAYQSIAPNLNVSWTVVASSPTQLHSTTQPVESCCATTQINGTDNSGNFIDTVTSNDRMYTVFRDKDDSEEIKHLAFLTQNQTNLTTGVAGFADAAYTNGQTATIKVVGNTTTQSSLTPGTIYYVQGDGSVGTSASSAATVQAGVALTSTNLLIRQ